jgi:hypothetical protein
VRQASLFSREGAKGAKGRRVGGVRGLRRPAIRCRGPVPGLLPFARNDGGGAKGLSCRVSMWRESREHQENSRLERQCDGPSPHSAPGLSEPAVPRALRAQRERSDGGSGGGDEVRDDPAPAEAAFGVRFGLGSDRGGGPGPASSRGGQEGARGCPSTALRRRRSLS